MTEHMQDYLALIREMIVIKNEQCWDSYYKNRDSGLNHRQQLREQIAILEEKKIEVESFIKSGPKTYGEKTQ